MIVLEHSLLILLLLVGLLNARPRLPALAQLAIAAALGMAFVAPSLPIDLPWAWLSALAVPLLLWQAARRLAEARWPADRREIGLWSWVVVGIGLTLLLTSPLTASGALLFGLLAASMAWRATEDGGRPSHLGQLGPLAMAFLLAEIAPAVEAPGAYALALAGGAGLGAAAGFAGVHLARRVPSGRLRDVAVIGFVYLAYALAAWLGLSSVAGATFTVIALVAYGARRGLWSDGVVRPKPLDSPAIYGLAVIALGFFGWQTHVPLTPVLVVEVGLGLLVTGAAVWAGRALRIPTFRSERSFRRVMTQVALLLVPALLLWPREALLDPTPLGLALLSAGAAALAANLALAPLLQLYGWLSEVGAAVERTDLGQTALPVGELMTRSFASAAPETPATDLARQLVEAPTGCVVIVDVDRRLLGIVTESDLFLRPERLPHSSQTYQALFKEPVRPEMLPEVYARLGSQRPASQVMTSRVVWVKETASIGSVLRIMAQHGFRRLPVVAATPPTGGQVVGVLTRADVIRWLIEPDRADGG